MLRFAIRASSKTFSPLFCNLGHFSKHPQVLNIEADFSRRLLHRNAKLCLRCSSLCLTSGDSLFKNPEENQKWQQLREIFNPSQLDQTVQNLVDMGYSRQEAGKMVLGHPNVTRVSRDTMHQTLLHLESFGFKTEVRQNIASECPTLFSLSASQLKKNFNDLQTALGNKDAKTVITKSPEVLTMNQQVVKQKLNYCTEAMGLKPSAIVNSGILRYDLKFIKLRHGLLEKAGYYKFPELLKKDGTETNPSVNDMFLTSDEKFVSIFSGITMEDYVVYEEMMNSQEEEFDLDEDEDQSEEYEARKNNYNTLRKRV